MRLLGIDPNGFAQRIQSQMIKLLASNRSDSAQNTRATASTQPLPPTAHKVSVRNLPLPQSAHAAAADHPSVRASLAALGQPQADPIALRAIAQFTEGQAHLVGPDTHDGTPGTAVIATDTPAVLSPAQSNQPIAHLANELGSRIKETLTGLLKTHDATIRTATVLLIASGIALAVIVM